MKGLNLMLLTKIKITSKDNIISRLSSDLGAHIEIVRCKANDLTEEPAS